MSQAEALLNQAARSGMYTASPETEPHIVIGADRVIVVPDELKRLGVQFDHNIETVVFDCPRYWDDTDMSLMAVYINYERRDGVRGQYFAENVTVDEADETMMRFEWTISKSVTLVEGKVKFNVCIKSVDDEGNEEEHWNSELCEDCYISEGLEGGAVIEPMYPDVITQLRTAMENVINSGMVVDVSMQKVDGVLHVTVTGPNGVDGFQIYDGNTPFIGDNGNWWIGNTDTGVAAAASTTGFMPASIYDPKGKATDIYQYVDDYVAENGVSPEDRAKWDAKSDFSGSYTDLADKPTIITVADVKNNLVMDSGDLPYVYVNNGFSRTVDFAKWFRRENVFTICVQVTLTADATDELSLDISVPQISAVYTMPTDVVIRCNNGIGYDAHADGFSTSSANNRSSARYKVNDFPTGGFRTGNKLSTHFSYFIPEVTP